MTTTATDTTATTTTPSTTTTTATTTRSLLHRIFLQEDLNFLLTTRIPRRLVTRFMAWFGKRRNPLVRGPSIALWRLFSGADFSDAVQTRFDSLHDAFIRQLRPDARAVDANPAVVTSPCDALIGAAGTIDGETLVQAKGSTYTLGELLLDPALARLYHDGCFVTLRLTAGMYHRFHAPHDLTVDRVDYVWGDTFNTNPITLARVEKLFVKNERAVIRTRLAAGGHPLTLVPVASILVASIRLHFADVLLHLGYRGQPSIPCRPDRTSLRKGEEMGWFELGSTILVFAPPGFRLAAKARPGATIRMGEPLLEIP